MAGEMILRTTLADTKSTTVLAGKRIKVENDGVTLLNERVPVGKQWLVTITVYIEQSDVA